MPTGAIELETVDETVLYKYDEIVRRLDTRKQKRLIADFHLLPHYAKIKPKGLLTEANLQKLGLLDGRAPYGDTENDSIKFWRQLQSYDELLEEVEVSQSRIAYDEFVKIKRKEIGEIFEFKSNKEGQYNTSKLLDYYKIIWDIGGFKGDDVQISKGIWFDANDNAYVVGDVNGFNDKQDRANLVRRFDILYTVGDDLKFDLEAFLEATSVQFIRYKQYTVYPYPFYLIEKYIQDVLYHQ